MSKKDEALKLAQAVIDAARAAMDDSFEAGNEQMDISIPAHLAAALSLRLDEYDREALAEQPATPFGIGGGLVAIKTLLSRDPCAHAKVAIEMIDAMLAEQPAQQESEAVRAAWMAGYTEGEREAIKKEQQPAQQEPIEEFAYKAITKRGEHCHFGTHAAARIWAGEGGKVETIKLRHLELVEQPAQQQDLPDFIAGALGVSRGTAYDMMREVLAGVQEPEPQRWAAYLEGDERVTCYDTEGEACSERECEIDNDFEPGLEVEYLVAPMLSAKQVLRTRDAYWFGDRFVEEVNNDLADEMGAEDSPLSIDKEDTEALGKLVMDFLCTHGKTQWWTVDHKREEKHTYVAGSNDEADQSKGDA